MTPDELAELKLAREAIRTVQAPIECSKFCKQATAAVVVASYNRPKMLKSTVEQLFQQDYPKLQIVVIDSSPTSNKYLSSICPNNNRRFAYIMSHVHSLCILRNLGLLATQSEIIIFIDDDVYIDTDFVSRHVAIHHSKEGKEARMVAGNCIPSPKEPSQWVTKQVYYRPEGRYATGAYGVNFSLKRRMALLCGGFNPYIRQIGDEGEIFGRLIQNANQALNGREVVLVHRVARDGGGRYRKYESNKLAMRMADRVLVKAKKKWFFMFTPMFIGFQIGRSLMRKELSIHSLKGIEEYWKEFIWYCLRNSIRAKKFRTFFSVSLEMGKPMVLKGKDVKLLRAKKT